MKQRVISGCVTVTGPPSAIWRRNMGTTLPRLPSTLPKRTEQKRVRGCRAASARRIPSATLLVAPMTVSYTHLRAHETKANLVCRLLLEKKKKKKKKKISTHYY